MRRSPFLALLAAMILLPAPTAVQAASTTPDSAERARAAAALAEAGTPGTVWMLDPATGRAILTVDDTVGAAQVAALTATATRAGAVLRREPGRLSTLIAGGEAIYAGGGGRCSLGANVRSGSVWYFVTAGHCTNITTSWYANSTQTTVLGTRTGTSFPGNDYGIVRYTNSTIPHPSATYTYPGLLPANGIANPTIGLRVCRSGSTTGVRCGTISFLNATVNYAEGSVSGLIRTNICAEPGDSGGPLYVATTGAIIGILSGGSGNCTSGGTSYYQPIAEILARYGVTLP